MIRWVRLDGGVESLVRESPGDADEHEPPGLSVVAFSFRVHTSCTLLPRLGSGNPFALPLRRSWDWAVDDFLSLFRPSLGLPVLPAGTDFFLPSQCQDPPSPWRRFRWRWLLLMICHSLIGLLCGFFAGAHNMRIGGSGSQAPHNRFLSQVCIHELLLRGAAHHATSWSCALFRQGSCYVASSNSSMWSCEVLLEQFPLFSATHRLECPRGKSVALGSPPSLMCAFVSLWLCIATGLLLCPEEALPSTSANLLRWAEQQAGSLLATVAAMTCAGLLALLCPCRFGRLMLAGWLNSWHCRGRVAESPVGIVCCLGRVSSVVSGPLIWRPLPVHRRRYPGPQSPDRPRSKQCWEPLRTPKHLLWVVAWLLGFLSLPIPCGACMPPGLGLILAVQHLHSGDASSHVSTSLPEPAPSGRIEELVTHVGEPGVPSAPRIDPEESPGLPWLTVDVNALSGWTNQVAGRWLEVHVFTPHYRPIVAAVRCLYFHDAQHVADTILDFGPGGPAEVSMTCVPLRPQGSLEFGSFLRFPTSIHHHPQRRHSAVLVDLRPVGGHSFACILPSRFSLRELLPFAQNMVPFSEQQLLVYVGDGLTPHVHDDLRLCDGDVLVFTHENLSRRHVDVCAHPFIDPSRWRPPSSLENPVGGEGFLVHYNQERFFMPPHHYSGQDPVSAVRSAYDLQASECVTAVFRTDDLEFRGNACSHVLGLFPLPAEHLDAPPNARRRDFVALCDFRPVGYSPRLVLVHVPIVHLPSLAALFGIRVPSGLRLRSLNGTQTGDEVEFSGHQVLTFVFEECPDAQEPVSAFALLDDLLDSSPPYHNVPVHFRAEGRSQAAGTGRREGRDVHRSRSRPGRSAPNRMPRDEDMALSLCRGDVCHKGFNKILSWAFKWSHGNMQHAPAGGTHDPTPNSPAGKSYLKGRWRRPFAFAPWNDPSPAVKTADQIDMWGPWYHHDALPEGTLELTPTVCPMLEAALPTFCLVDLYSQKGPHVPWDPMSCKLLSEPESHSLAARDRIEDARDFEEGEGRIWPYLPAGDQYAMQRLAERAETEEDTFQSEGASDLTFCLLTPGYILESVVVTLTAPVEIPEALDAVQMERDQVRRRLYPSLVVVEPQPVQGFGALLALPAWTSPEVFICFSLLDIDDRLFAAPVPAVVSRERLLEIAVLTPAEQFDVYVGGSPTPMLEGQEVGMMRGMCVLFFHRHVLPGPYFNLTESLLSSTVWESEPSIPFGPSDGHMCFVGEFALRRLPLAEDTSFPDAALVADAMGLNPSTMLVQPALPATRDVAIDGFYCYNVCAALDPADQIEPSDNPTCVVLVDCRALLQGWQMVSSPAAILSRRQLLEDLETFAPPGWSVHLEGVPSDCDLCDVTPGQVLYASYVMDTHPRQGSLMTEPSENAHIAESDESDSELSLQSVESGPGSAERDRSRSPYRNPEIPAGTLATAPVQVPFLLLGQEYAPELVVVLRTEDPKECIRSIQNGRDHSSRSRFGQIVTVHPQPAAEYALMVAKPTWSTHVFVVFDCLKVNGVAFCWLASPAMTRSAILAVSGLPDTSDYEVYAPDRDMPLGQFEVCNLETGACISIIPATCQFFVVTSLEDMLLSNDGWSTEAAVPCAPGEWLYVLSDSGPCSLQFAETRADLLAPAVATILELPLQTATLQFAVPPVDDFADEGRLAWNVVAATSDLSYRQGCIYFLDLRPILCGLTWAHSPDGTVSIELIRAQCARPAAGGHQVRVLGGRPLADAPGMVSVWPGEVLIVTVPDSSEPPVASGSSCEAESESHGPAGSGSEGFSDPEHSTMPGNGRSPNASAARDTSALPGAPSEHRLVHFRRLLGRRPVDCLPPQRTGRDERQRSLVHVAITIVVVTATVVFVSAIRREASLALCLLPLGYSRRLLSVLAVLWITRFPVVASVQIKMPEPFPSGAEMGPFPFPPQIRAVATPCRGLALPRCTFSNAPEAPASSAAGIDFEDLSTLLDECVRAPGCTAFFDTATLVETLFEHFYPHLLQEAALAQPVCPPPLVPKAGDLACLHDISADEPPCQLILSALLPPGEASASKTGAAPATEWYALDRGSCSIPVSDEHWRDLTRFTPLTRLMLTMPADTSALCLTSDGSFSESQGAAGWGLVISAITPDHPDVPGSFIGFTAAASIDTWHFGGDEAPALNAFCSEIVGLFWAAVAAFQIPFDGQVIFRCDNEAALGIASGSHVAPSQVVTAACQSLHQAFALRFPGRAVYVHVRGHSGDPANELADASANRGAVTPMPKVFQLDLPAWFCPGGSAFQWLPHLGWTLARPLQGPPCESGSLRWDLTEPTTSLDAEQLMRPFTRAFPAHKESRVSAQKLCLGFATFNTLSLACPGEDRGVQSGMYGHTGRVALLDASLFAEEIFVAGLQETRTPEGQLYSKHYHRYCSGCLEKRAFGIEIWVCVAKGWPSHKAVVLHASPTRLLLRLSTCGKNLGVLAAHGLHRGHSSADRLAWWKETSDLCLAVCSGLEWVFLLDGNCAIGSTVSQCVGSFGAEEEDTAGEAMHHLLRACNTWVPSTFPDAFTGDSGTLVQKRSGTLSRRDYVALPNAWRDCVKRGHVSPGINAGHSVPDHFAVVIQVELHLCTGRAPKSSARIDGEALLLPHNREAVEGIISALPQVPWTVNVNDHVAHLVDSLYEGLVSRFPRQRRRMRNSFLSEETSLVHASLAAHRHALRWRMAEMRRCYKRCAFLAWRSHDAFDDIFCGVWIRQLRISIGQITLAVGQLGRQIRRLCRRDRVAFLNKLAVDVDEADVSSVHKALRHLLRPKKFRRSGPDPLPRLRRPDGSYCQTPDEITAE